MAVAQLKIKCDSLRTDRGRNFWDPATVQMKCKFEKVWTDAVNNADEKLDLSMGELDEEVEDLGYKLLLVGPLVDFYLKNIAKGVKHRLRKSRMTGLMNDFTLPVPFDILKYICVLWRNYDGRVTSEKRKMTFVATARKTVKKMFSPVRFDGSNCLRKTHFHKIRKPSVKGKRKRVEHIPCGHSSAVITANTPFKMVYNFSSELLKVSFYRQNYSREGIAEDMTLQAMINKH